MARWVMILCLLAGPAFAADADLRFQNPGDAAMTRIQVLPTLVEHAVQCAAKSECTQRVQLPHGVTSVSIKAQAGGTLWSAPSNVIAKRVVDPVTCLADPICSTDRDRNGNVTIAEAATAIGALGKSWP